MPNNSILKSNYKEILLNTSLLIKSINNKLKQ